MLSISTARYDGLSVNESEVFRYLGCASPDETQLSLLKECLKKAAPLMKGDVCFTDFAVQTTPDTVTTPFTVIRSRKLAKHLEGCDACVMFAATLGAEFDRLIRQSAVLSPAKGVVMNALGSALIEEVCDRFNGDALKFAENIGKTAVSRFSPGYGDLPLALQRDIFDILQPQKNIGLALNANLFMTPVKSVTALIGLKPTD